MKASRIAVTVAAVTFCASILMGGLVAMAKKPPNNKPAATTYSAVVLGEIEGLGSNLKYTQENFADRTLDFFDGDGTVTFPEGSGIAGFLEDMGLHPFEVELHVRIVTWQPGSGGPDEGIPVAGFSFQWRENRRWYQLDVAWLDSQPFKPVVSCGPIPPGPGQELCIDFVDQPFRLIELRRIKLLGEGTATFSITIERN